MDRDKDLIDEHSDFDSFMTNWSSTDTDERKLTKANDEEFAAEFADPNVYTNSEAGRHYRARENDSDLGEMEENQVGAQALSWSGLIFAIASWFIWPLIMGVVAIVLGIMAYRTESRTMGGWAIALGAVTLAFNLIVFPLYYSFIS